MCIDLATASIALSVVGGAAQAAGMMQQGQQAKAQASYQAAVLRNNQILADRAAADALKRGEEAEAQHSLRVRATIGQQRAALASHGVLVDQGSALDITSDTAAQGAYDALVIRNNAAREALGYTAKGIDFGAQAGLQDAAGANAMRGAYFGAGTTLLTTAGTVADKWYTYQQLQPKPTVSRKADIAWWPN